MPKIETRPVILIQEKAWDKIKLQAFKAKKNLSEVLGKLLEKAVK